MAKYQIRIAPLGDSALTVEFGNSISETINRRVIAAAQKIDELRFPGFIEMVPTYASASVFYDPVEVRRVFPDFPTCFDAVSSIVRDAIADLNDERKQIKAPIQIPVDFDGDAAPDLELVAAHNSLSKDEVISIFVSKVYRVYMLGFLPGFTYMGQLDRRIGTPRKEMPRTTVKAGSVGIAGRQTGIYSLSSPGGWQIIGRTDAQIFRSDADPPCLFSAGDLVRFVASK